MFKPWLENEKLKNFFKKCKKCFIFNKKENLPHTPRNDSYDLSLCTAHHNGDDTSSNSNHCGGALVDTIDGSTLNGNHNDMGGNRTCNAAIAGCSTLQHQHQLNLNVHLNHQRHLLAHHTPYTRGYYAPQTIHSEQTKSLQELQNEVGALLEFRDLVIETFPDLKQKMASMSSSNASSSTAAVTGASVSVANTLTGSGTASCNSLASRREWEPGIRSKRKFSQKDPSIQAAPAANGVATAADTAASAATAAAAGSNEMPTSLTRSRSNSHSGKKEPKSGENNGSVVQDSGFSTETSSSKEGHSASSTNGAMTGPTANNRLTCTDSDDELLNLLDVIHRKSNRLREEVEQLQNFERNTLQQEQPNTEDGLDGERVCSNKPSTSNSSQTSTISTVLTHKSFREHVERLSKEDIRQLRKERDRLLDKLAEMEAETLTGRIKAAKMSDEVEELISVKKDLEEQLKLAMAQKLELSSRVQQLQQQQQNSKSSSSQSDLSSQRLSSATTVLSAAKQSNTFQPVVIEQHGGTNAAVAEASRNILAFHQSTGSDSRRLQSEQPPLGRLDGVVSTPFARHSKSRTLDSKRTEAILLETNVIELRRHLLTLTVQNQVLMQKLDQSGKSRTHLIKRLDKSKDDVEDLRFQLEEKNIELEGTKAQLRVLESRMHSVTPSMGASYSNSHQDYETNRSSASTTLMLSRRGLGNDTLLSGSRAGTPLSVAASPATPTAMQISTPSMKAMTHLPMDELQHHSSSTESAHDLQHELPHATDKLMSASVGGTSPFMQNNATTTAARQQQQAMVKRLFNSASKPSRIPLPGSKAAAYFAAKPPTGRLSTARSPPSTGSMGSGSNKSSLSRSTGNLLSSGGKSQHSLLRVDSSQSMRKDASCSLSTNASRGSTSSIPMAITPYSSAKSSATSATTATTPSPRVLQNSPLPKLKRETFSSRLRQMDSLSRAQQQSVNSNELELGKTPPKQSGSSDSNKLLKSTHRSSSTARMSASLSRELAAAGYTTPTVASSAHQATRRGTTGSATSAVASTTRRARNTIDLGRTAAGRQLAEQLAASANASRSATTAEQQQAQQQQQQQLISGAGDNDSGKVRTIKSTLMGWLKI